MDRETFQENVANTIEYMIFEEGVKYVDVARKADIAQSSLYSYKQRIGLISHDKAIRLADAMGIPLENLSRRTKKSNTTFRVRLGMVKTSTISDAELIDTLKILATPNFPIVYQAVMGQPFKNPNQINLETCSIHIGIGDIINSTKTYIEIHTIGVDSLQTDVKASTTELMVFVSRLLRFHMKDMSYRVLYT